VQTSQPAPRRQMSRWAEASSSDEEVVTQRVVRPRTDKRYEQMLDRINQMRNHQKIDDFSSLITDYETVCKMLDKLKVVVEQDGGPPRQFVKAIFNLENYVEKLHQQHVERKQNTGERLSENKQRAFNTLRSKVRKGNKNFQDELDKMRANPGEFESDSDEQQAEDDSESSGSEAASASSSTSSKSESSSNSSDSDSDSDGSSSDSSSSSGSGSDWTDNEQDSSSDGDLDEEAAREKKMLRWLITPEKLGERGRRCAAEKSKTERSAGRKGEKPHKDKSKTGADSDKPKDGKDKKKGEEQDEYTSEELIKKVQEISQQRGRRGFDKKSYEEKLMTLMPHAVKQSASHQLHIWSTMVSADFDGTGGAFGAMKIERWQEALGKVSTMLPLLIEAYHDHVQDGSPAPVGDDGEDPTSQVRQQELFVAFVDKLDDELYKALQYTLDVYGQEYQEILANSSNCLVLVKRVLKFFEETNQPHPRGLVALRMMDQIYFKPDSLNKKVYEAIHHTVPENEKDDWIWPEDSKSFMAKLCKYVYATGQVRLQRRASLFQAYHLALHDHFQAARDLLHLGNIQEHASEFDIHTQILYNRVLAGMGLCGFRMGKIQDAHNCLMDVCVGNKARELLAQGLSYSKSVDRTPEQERAERLRQLPYHMHINLEVLDSAHHICAMLLEVPNLAMQSYDPNRKNNMISRSLRRSLEQYEKQVYTGPPENAKEAVVCAAKAMQRGDWRAAFSALDELKIWEHVDPGNPAAGLRVKEMIKDKVKTEALRTYLFAYASIYDAFHLDQLVDMFELPAKTIHSIVSKMMFREEITAFWDESSKFVLVQHSEPSPLQRLALALAEKGVQAVDNNERLVDQKSGSGFFGRDSRGPAQQGRWDQSGNPSGDRRRFGKGGAGMSYGMDKGKGKGRGKVVGAPRNRGWENARAGAALRGSAQRGWSTRPT